jgi:hypothetical protein
MVKRRFFIVDNKSIVRDIYQDLNSSVYGVINQLPYEMDYMASLCFLGEL